MHVYYICIYVTQFGILDHVVYVVTSLVSSRADLRLYTSIQGYKNTGVQAYQNTRIQWKDRGTAHRSIIYYILNTLSIWLNGQDQNSRTRYKQNHIQFNNLISQKQDHNQTRQAHTNGQDNKQRTSYKQIKIYIIYNI